MKILFYICEKFHVPGFYERKTIKVEYDYNETYRQGAK